MPTTEPAPRWREARRDVARGLILEAAWASVHEDGLASLSLRRLAARAGVTPPTVYAYFSSKNAIYDAMFLEAATQFEERMTEAYDAQEADAVLIEGIGRFLEFCTEDTVRYQLLFERVLPGFEPSAGAYAPAVRALDNARTQLRAAGVTQRRHIDLWTALTTGLASQQISNDPGGSRWTELAGEAAAMLLAHCQAENRSGRVAKRNKGARTKETNR